MVTERICGDRRRVGKEQDPEGITATTCRLFVGSEQARLSQPSVCISLNGCSLMSEVSTLY